MQRTLGLRGLVGTILLVLLLLWSSVANAWVVSQHCINRWAAAADSVRHALIVDTGLRLPGEQVDAYLRRIALPLPTESPIAYQRRMESYFHAFLVAKSVLLEAASPSLSLHDRSPKNLRLWQQIVSLVRSLPRQLHFLQTDWNRHTNPKGQLQFVVQFNATTHLYLDLYELLRDALP